MLALLLSSLAAAGVRGLHLDLGHVGVYRALANGAGIAGNGERQRALRGAARQGRAGRRRARPRSCPRRGATRSPRCPRCTGPRDEVLAAARARLPDTPAIANALVGARRRWRAPAAPQVEALHIDLADLRGYHYQSGAIFSVFTAGEANAIGRGGRYDGIGKAFGRARPATGFTLDLRQLAASERASPAAN